MTQQHLNQNFPDHKTSNNHDHYQINLLGAEGYINYAINLMKIGKCSLGSLGDWDGFSKKHPTIFYPIRHLLIRLVDEEMNLLIDDKDIANLIIKSLEVLIEEEEKLQGIEPIDLVTIFHRLAKYQDGPIRNNTFKKRFDRALSKALPRLLEVLQIKATELKVQQVPSTLWALAKMGYFWKGLDEKLQEALINSILDNAKLFGEQGIANTIWALATMGCKWKELGAALQSVLRRVIKHNVNHFVGQGVTNTIWALAVLHENEKDTKNVVRKIIEEANTKKIKFSNVSLLQLIYAKHYFGISFDKFGHLENQIAMYKPQKNTVSNFEKNVGRYLKDICNKYNLKLDFSTVEEKIQHDIDLTIVDEGLGLKVAIEVDGDYHFFECFDGDDKIYIEKAHTTLRNKVLNELGWDVITVPFYEWNREKNKTKYLENKLQSLINIQNKQIEQLENSKNEGAISEKCNLQNNTKPQKIQKNNIVSKNKEKIIRNKIARDKKIPENCVSLLESYEEHHVGEKNEFGNSKANNQIKNQKQKNRKAYNKIMQANHTPFWAQKNAAISNVKKLFFPMSSLNRKIRYGFWSVRHGGIANEILGFLNQYKDRTNSTQNNANQKGEVLSFLKKLQKERKLEQNHQKLLYTLKDDNNHGVMYGSEAVVMRLQFAIEMLELEVSAVPLNQSKANDYGSKNRAV